MGDESLPCNRRVFYLQRAKHCVQVEHQLHFRLPQVQALLDDGVQGLGVWRLDARVFVVAYGRAFDAHPASNLNAIKTKTALGSGFYNAGTQVVTAKSVDMANGLPPVTFEQAQAMAADPAATAKYYKPWIESLAGKGLTASVKPIAAESE